MEETNRSITVSLKIFNRAFPQRISLTLPLGSRVRDVMARVERENFEPKNKKDSSWSLQDLAEEDLLVILNGRAVQNLQGYDTQLQEGDVLAIFPVMAGG